MAGALRLPPSNADDRGALVASVEPDSPALRAGIQPGDVITAVNGHQIANPRELAITISQIAPGGDAVLAVYRNGNNKSVDVTVGTLQGDQASGRVGNSPQGSPSLGVGLQALTPNLRQQLSVPEGVRGAVISEVQPGSVAEQAGLQAGDVIVGVGEQTVTSPSEATHAIRDALKNSQAVALRIIRDGQPAFVAVTPSQNDQANNDNDDDSR